jgi:hypothetical protein
MTKTTTQPKLAEGEEEPASELYYNVNPKDGDVNITIIANRGSTVHVVSGKPQDPPHPPHG